MKIKDLNKKITTDLSPAGISQAVEMVDNYFIVNNIGYNSRLCYRLLMEELLLDYMNEDADRSFTVICVRLWKKVVVTVSVRGEKSDFLNEHKSIITEKLRENLNPEPVWNYVRGKNIIIFTTIPLYLDKDAKQFMWDNIRQDNRYFMLGILLRFVNMGLAILEPLLSAWIIVAYSGSHIQKIIFIAALIFMQAAASSLINWASSRMLQKTYASITRNLQTSIMKSVLKIKTEYMDRNSNGVFIQRMTDETQKLTDCIDSLLEASTMVFRLISLLIAFLVISVKMFLFELLLFTVYFLIKKAQTDHIVEDTRLSRIADEKHAGFIGEMVKAHRDIKLLHCEDSFLSRVNFSIDESVDLNTKTRLRSMNYILLPHAVRQLDRFFLHDDACSADAERRNVTGNSSDSVQL